MRTLVTIAILAATASASNAGPCSSQISDMQAQIDAKLEAAAAAGPTARQGTFAGRHEQPTPRSMAAAEAESGELSSEVRQTIQDTMAQARAADAAGDLSGCQKALATVQSVVGKAPQ